MNEEEIIEKCELIAYVGTSCYTVDEDKKAIQGLIDLYNKEKEKNKELEIKLKQIESLKHIEEDLTSVYLNGFYEGESKWKSKIKELLEHYKNTGYNELEEVLQELLEEGE